MRIKMLEKNLNLRVKWLILTCVLLAPLAQGATFDLIAGPFNQMMPDGVIVPMWGFGLAGQSITSPGPVLEIPHADNNLTINLTNNLPVPISLVIPGLQSSLTPVYHGAGDAYEGRVRSLTTETAPYATLTYTWNNVIPGTYMYHSGTQMQIQIQMGLFGAVKHNFASQQAYNDVSTAYDNEVLLLYSEIDPVLHNAVQTGAYGSTGAITSTVDYWPRYFLINGRTYVSGQTPIPAGVVNQKLLLRFLNAGLRTHTPIIHNYFGLVIAEDGNLMRFPRQQYEILLTAGKSFDMLLQPTIAGNIPIYDRKLDLTTGLASPGGMLVNLNVSSAAQKTIKPRPNRISNH